MTDDIGPLSLDYLLSLFLRRGLSLDALRVTAFQTAGFASITPGQNPIAADLIRTGVSLNAPRGRQVH